nr:MAG TPA: immunity protein [Caudoviricetes sp.]
MKISDLVKSLEKVKAKHGDLPIAFEISDDDCCHIDIIHVTKIYDDDETVLNSGYFDVKKLDENVKYLNISYMGG